MNREIKFRMWHEGKMEQPAFKLDTARLLEGMATNPDAPVVVGLDTLIPRMQDRGVLMQYTGLKDKNGKEIYEGDVLGAVQISNTICHAVVEYANATFLVRHTGGEEWTDRLMNAAWISEVIGNIHENPELLKP